MGKGIFQKIVIKMRIDSNWKNLFFKQQIFVIASVEQVYLSRLLCLHLGRIFRPLFHSLIFDALFFQLPPLMRRSVSG